MNTKNLLKFAFIASSLGMVLSTSFGDTSLVNAFGFSMLSCLIVWHKG